VKKETPSRLHVGTRNIVLSQGGRDLGGMAEWGNVINLNVVN